LQIKLPRFLQHVKAKFCLIVGQHFIQMMQNSVKLITEENNGMLLDMLITNIHVRTYLQQVDILQSKKTGTHVNVLPL